MKRLGRVVVAAMACAAVACGGGVEQAAAPPPSAPATAPGPAAQLEPSEPFGLTAATLTDPAQGTEVKIPVYDAFEPRSRARGLMGRKRLPRRAGMVFRFPADHRGGFWMKDTLIPLSIAFFDANGTVVKVLDMPPCRKDPCPSYDPGVKYRGAVEVNRGFFDEIGLKQGWRVGLPLGLPPAS